MDKALLSVSFLLAALMAAGQTCIHSNLSKSLSFKTQPIRLKRKDGYDSCRVHITVVNKLLHQTVFKTTLASGFLYTSNYAHCNAARSYTTGAGQGADVEDYDYGDLVVADFNFDGKEDFAAKNDAGGNRGPLYAYFIQTSSGSFVLDKFLTERMALFPNRITKATRTLTLESERWNERFRTSYRLNAKTGKWREIKYEPVIIQPGLRITE